MHSASGITQWVEFESLINVADYSRAATRAVPNDVLDYFEGGALDEITLRENTVGQFWKVTSDE